MTWGSPPIAATADLATRPSQEPRIWSKTSLSRSAADRPGVDQQGREAVLRQMQAGPWRPTAVAVVEAAVDVRRRMLTRSLAPSIRAVPRTILIAIAAAVPWRPSRMA